MREDVTFVIEKMNFRSYQFVFRSFPPLTIQIQSHQLMEKYTYICAKIAHFMSISCFYDLDIEQISYNIMSYFLNIILISNILYYHLKIKCVHSADLNETRNTATFKFAFCDCTLIVGMVTLQEPYFPKHVFS